MTKSLPIMMLMALCVSCATPGALELPPVPGAPADWYDFSTATLPGSECPNISGEYLEPPLIERTGDVSGFFPKGTKWLFFGYIPLHRADRKVLPVDAFSGRNNSFIIRQPNAGSFDFLFLNYDATAASRYRFRSDEGNFSCHDGQIEFPVITRYGMIEGMSFNFQIRNVLMKDASGALVIQSTRGPSRGHRPRPDKILYEFMRYPLSPDDTTD